MKVKLIHERAQMPTRATPGSAGLDLYCIERVEIPPHAQAVLPTGLQIELPGRWFKSRMLATARAGMGVLGVQDCDD